MRLFNFKDTPLLLMDDEYKFYGRFFDPRPNIAEMIAYQVPYQVQNLVIPKNNISGLDSQTHLRNLFPNKDVEINKDTKVYFTKHCHLMRGFYAKNMKVVQNPVLADVMVLPESTLTRKNLCNLGDSQQEIFMSNDGSVAFMFKKSLSQQIKGKIFRQVYTPKLINYKSDTVKINESLEKLLDSTCIFEGNVFTTRYKSSYVEDLEEMVLLKKPFIFERDFLKDTQQFKIEPTLIEMKNLYSMLKSSDKDTVQLATSMLNEYAWFDYPKTFTGLLGQFSYRRRNITRYLGKLNTEASMIVELFKQYVFDGITSKDEAADKYIAENLYK